jgi:taurine dioxygenase
MLYRRIEAEPIAGALGAEIGRVNLAEPLDAETVAEIRQALLEYLVIFFRDQDLTPDDQLRFVRYFGEPEIYPLVQGLEGHPEITPVLKQAHETVNFGGLWHSDTVYLERPPMAAVLVARELPLKGGDTMWANQYMAYETLSEGLRSVLDRLKAVHSSAKADVTRTREDRLKSNPTDKSRTPLVSVHPAVRMHPETGRKALFVNVGHTIRFDGWSEAESQPLLEYLFRHQVRPEFTCRFHWQPGSIAFWDNRCTQHNPINDYHGYRRLMHRVIIAGDIPH